MNTVEKSNYTITHRSDILDETFGITPDIANKIGEMAGKVHKKKNSAVKELQGLIKQYPHIPHFKNHLSVLFNQQGNLKKANELHLLTSQEHPDYLYGKLNVAFRHMFDKEYDKVPEVLGEDLEIGSLYPDRNEFNYDEVLCFDKAALLYFIETDKYTQAEERLKRMLDLDEDSQHSIWAEDKMMAYRWERRVKRAKKAKEMERSVTVVAAKVVEETDEKPRFNHNIVEQLYCNSLRMPHTIITEILSLPKETLLQDLHAVVYDSIARFKHFNDMPFDITTHEIIKHALFLIGELQSPESLPVVLDMLRQDEKYLEFWLYDSLSEIVEECIFSIGLYQTEELLAFLKEPDRYVDARSCVAEAMAQIALHYPERRPEVIQWFNNIFGFYISQKNDDRIIDTELIGIMVWECLDINATELIPIIGKLYSESLADIEMCGDWNDVKKSFEESPSDKIKLRKNVYEKYNDFLDGWDYESDSDLEDDGDFFGELEEEEVEVEVGEEEEDDDDDDNNHFNTYEEAVAAMPAIFPKPKVGRNAPCPCGSGKKFKRCCGKD